MRNQGTRICLTGDRRCIDAFEIENVPDEPGVRCSIGVWQNLAYSDRQLGAA